jgi:hypothetical protein
MISNEISQERQNDYLKYRGKCKELAEAAVAADPSLRLVRGYYHCPLWGKQAHWWAEKTDGTIVDPSVKQFPSCGEGEYEEFDGYILCDECRKRIHESEARIEGRYAFCSYQCLYKFVGLIEKTCNKKE